MDAGAPANIWLLGISALTLLGGAWASYLQYRSSKDKFELQLLSERFKETQQRLDQQESIVARLTKEISELREQMQKAYRRLQDKQDLLEKLTDELSTTSVHGVVIANHSGLVSLCNDKFAEITGYTLNELIGMPLTRLMPERFRADHLEAIKSAMEHQAIIDREPMTLPILLKDGTEKLARIRILGWVHEDKRQTRFVGIVHV
jgi:PAS domain S-box-containing protein